MSAQLTFMDKITSLHPKENEIQTLKKMIENQTNLIQNLRTEIKELKKHKDQLTFVKVPNRKKIFLSPSIFSRRTFSLLQSKGYETLEQLEGLTCTKIRNWFGAGEQTVNEIKAVCLYYGVRIN